MLYSVITTIQKPTASVLGLVNKLNEVGGKLIVTGDKKGPADFHPPSSEWRSTFVLRGSGVTMVTGGESDYPKYHIHLPLCRTVSVQC